MDYKQKTKDIRNAMCELRSMYPIMVQKKHWYGVVNLIEATEALKRVSAVMSKMQGEL